MPDLSFIPLEHLGVLALRGADAHSFLQGQLSNDVTALQAGESLFGGLHTPQGRCLALLRVFALDGQQLLAVLPRELLAPIAAHLGKYRLRARVQIETAQQQWHVYGLHGPDAAAAAHTRLHMPMDVSGLRQLILAPRTEAAPEGQAQPEHHWLAEDIGAGLPQVFGATSGTFTAQMLNLDRVAGVSFSKGCYTGQEIIARTHYLGTVKRRMRRFHAADGPALVPGRQLQLADGRRAQVVLAAPVEGGGQEFLAVAGPQPRPDEMEAGSAAAPLQAAELPLPYAD